MNPQQSTITTTTPGTGLTSASSSSLPLPKNYGAMSARYVANSFAENIIEDIEKYLDEQVQEGSYDFQGSRTLLKLYLYFPHKIKTEYIVIMLLKALCNVPQNDYIILLYMVPEYLSFADPGSSSSDVAIVKQAINMIERGNFEDFWKLTKSSQTSRRIFMECVPELIPALRKYIINLYRITYRFVDISQLQANTGFQDEAELRKWMEDNNIEGGFF